MKAADFKRIRKKLDLTQEELGLQINRTRYRIIDFENGDKIPEEISLAMKYLELKFDKVI